MKTHPKSIKTESTNSINVQNELKEINNKNDDKVKENSN